MIAPYISSPSSSKMPVILATTYRMRHAPNSSAPINAFPGCARSSAALNSHHKAQPPVATMIGACPPCSVVQVSLATSNMVGTKIAAMPTTKMAGAHGIVRCAVSDCGGLTSNKVETQLFQGLGSPTHGQG